MNTRWGRAWSAVATSWLVASLLFLVLNVAAWAWLRRPRPRRNPVVSGFGAAIYTCYPGWARAAVDDLLAETWLHPQFEYEAFTQFREIPRRGRYVNVSAHGFRVTTGAEPWPPDPAAFNVFVFGGSTTFGYGVPDADTVPARLRRRLNGLAPKEPLHVYNFGRGHYYSAQERVLFEKLLVEGHRPNLAVFVDGTNETRTFTRFGGARFSETLARLMREAAHPPARLDLPVTRFLSALRTVPGSRPDAGPELNTSVPAAVVVDHYRRNKPMIAAVAASASAGVQAVFVWQPVPNYKYDLRLHPLREHVGPPSPAHEQMAGLASAGELGPDFAWCADIQQDVPRLLYVDRVHYNAEGADLLAGCIVDALVGRGIVGREALTSRRPPRNPSESGSDHRAP